MSRTAHVCYLVANVMAKLFHLDRRSFVPSQVPHRLGHDDGSAPLIELADLQRILDEAGPLLNIEQVRDVGSGSH